MKLQTEVENRLFMCEQEVDTLVDTDNIVNKFMETNKQPFQHMRSSQLINQRIRVLKEEIKVLEWVLNKN